MDFYIDPVCALIFIAAYGFSSLTKMNIHDLLDRTIDENSQMVILQRLAEYFNMFGSMKSIRGSSEKSVKNNF